MKRYPQIRMLMMNLLGNVSQQHFDKFGCFALKSTVIAPRNKNIEKTNN